VSLQYTPAVTTDDLSRGILKVLSPEHDPNLPTKLYLRSINVNLERMSRYLYATQSLNALAIFTYKHHISLQE